MTAKQLNRALTHLGITRAALATLVETNVRTVYRWTSGEWPVPAPVGLLLNLMLDHKLTKDDLRA